MSAELELAAEAPVTLFRTDDPGEVIARATETANALAAVVKAKNLTVRIGQGEHVKVEGWTMLGSLLGVFPVCVWTRKIEAVEFPAGTKVDGWEARVEARTRAGEVVGAAEAQCLRSEDQWGWTPKDRNGRALKPRDDYALRSMAQTRATSKALRLPLGFVMTLAGFEATPAEEMPRDSEPEPKASGEQALRAWTLIDKLGKSGALNPTEYAALLRSRYGTTKIPELSKSQASVVIDELEAMERDAAIPFE